MNSSQNSPKNETIGQLLRGLSSLFAPEERLVYVNRDIDFSHIKVVGFDLDYTLARYRQVEMDRLTLECVLPKLYEAGFPKQFRINRTETEFAMRGLVVDRLEGNILKLDRHGYVGHGFHGMQELDRKTLAKTYREQRIGVEKARFSPVDTLFSLPEVNLFAHAVDHFNQNESQWQQGAISSYEEIWDSIRRATDLSHQDDSIKGAIRKEPARYVAFDPELPAMLHRLRSLGKRVFLLTNSEPAHTETLLELLLSETGRGYQDWKSFFDWVIVSARKPGFFTHEAPFYKVEQGKLEQGTGSLRPKKGAIYSGGNQADFQKTLRVHADQVLFVGDHIYDDVVTSKKNYGWRTALIVEELEHDLIVRRNWGLAIQEVEGQRTLRKALSREIARMKFALNAMERSRTDEGVTLEGTQIPIKDYEDARNFLLQEVARKRDELRRLSDTIVDLANRVSQAFNPYWGSLFWEAHDISRFAQQAETFACAYTSRASNFLFVAPDETLYAGTGKLAHSWWSR
ncbi:MAG: HAD-IG family 5'-nucleotidase [Planctomycetes bacterium]|nr:HAD-IG family 5'-nucleotidase [Planctomycetota bacterium]